MAVTDHDTVAGIHEADEEGRSAGVEVIAGIEVSAETPAGDCHVLGYLVEAGSPFLREPLEHLRRERVRRVERIVERLRAAGVGVEVEPPAPGRSIGRPHVARALVEGGAAASIREAFDRYLRRGAPAYVPGPGFTPIEAIGMIRRAGGVAVVAHPESFGEYARIGAWASAGLDGVEAHYGPYDAATRERIARWAADRGLLATGGSDFHGDVRPEVVLGAERWPYEQVEALRRRARGR